MIVGIKERALEANYIPSAIIVNLRIWDVGRWVSDEAEGTSGGNQHAVNDLCLQAGRMESFPFQFRIFLTFTL